MDSWIGIAVVVGIGVAVVAYGYLWDRTTHRQRDQAMQSPPDRPIPGLPADAPAPAYVLPKKPDAKPSLDAAEMAALRELMDAAPTLPRGHGKGAFATDDRSDLAILSNPLILVTDQLSSIRELLPVAARAKKATRALVVVAEQIADEVFQTLETNTIAGTLPSAAIIANPATRAELAALVGATEVPSEDLKSGWVPDSALGDCATWVSSPSQLWVLHGEQDPVPNTCGNADGEENP